MGTNVSNINLPATAASTLSSTGGTTKAWLKSSTAHAAGAAFETSASCRRITEARLGLSVLAYVD
jgi:hypothetical protein